MRICPGLRVIVPYFYELHMLRGVDNDTHIYICVERIPSLTVLQFMIT